MIVNPHKVKNNIELIDEEQQIQPAGIDLTISKIFLFKSAGCIDFDNRRRKQAEVKEYKVLTEEPQLIKAGAYKIIFNEIIKIPENMAAIALPRSSLLRSGASVFTSLWDPGYEGRSEALLVVFNKNGIALTKNAKVAQLIFLSMDEKASKLYKGIYHRENIL